MLELDHLAVVAGTLEEGRERVEAALGVKLQPGGRHEHFGTHNMLLGLEDGLYLEVIAVDPKAPGPDYPRWFDLDRFSGPPRLGNWICRTRDLATAIRHFPKAGVSVPLSRGDLRWQMAVPGNGVLPYDNMFPALIEWQGADHPTERLAPSGCWLNQLVVSHPEADVLKQKLDAVLPEQRIVFQAGDAGLMAEIETPMGPRVLL